jgi:hypothetical protein
VSKPTRPPPATSRPGGTDATLHRAWALWSQADWTALADLAQHGVVGATDRAELLVLGAAAHFQQGNPEHARQLVGQAREAGATQQQLARTLLCSAHHSLGRAAILAGDPARAFRHFDRAAALGPESAEPHTSAPPRLQQQLAQLGATEAQVHAWLRALGRQGQPLKVEQVCAIDLGEGWSGNTVNTVIFRHHGILTWGEHQFTAFYVDEQRMRIVRRTLATNHIDTHDIEGEYNLRDAHNSISLGVDREGHLHISYDHHATRLRYRRSLHPRRIDAWTDELPMTGANEQAVTYPTFILPRAGYPLTLLYRDGVHNKGSARLKTYDEASQTWADRPVPILSGAEHKPWTSNAYWNHPAIGGDGSLHLSFVWRTGTLGEQQLVNNINIGYAWSPDNGLNWFTAHGRPCGLPMTQVNAEVVWAVPPGSNLINQTSMALDSHNRPHIVFYANDAQGVPQYQHLWFDGHTWQHECVLHRSAPFDLRGGGTLQIPISRPEVLVDQHDMAYLIFRGDLTGDEMSIVRLEPGQAGQGPVPLWPMPLGFAEPIIDRTRWAQDQTLTLLVQRTQQPDGDRAVEAQFDKAWLIDIRLH